MSSSFAARRRRASAGGFREDTQSEVHRPENFAARKNAGAYPAKLTVPRRTAESVSR